MPLEGIGVSNIGFMLSFEDNASDSLKAASMNYDRMERSMRRAMSTSTKTAMFDRGTNRMTKDLRKLSAAGFEAVGSMGMIKGVGSKQMGNVNINMRTSIPRMAEGGIALKESIVRVAERGAEAIIPLNRLGEKIKGGVGRTVDFFSDKSVKLMDTMFGAFRRVKREWQQTFGNRAPRNWNQISQSSGQVAQNVNNMTSDVRDISVMTALTGINDAFEQMKGIGNAEDAVASFRESTEKLMEVRGLSRKQMLEERKLLRDMYKGVNADINQLTDQYVDLTEKGFKLGKSTAELAKGLGMIRELTGVELTEAAENLSFGLGLTNDQIVDLYTSMRQVTKDNRFETTFANVTEVLNGVLPQLTQLNKTLTSTEKVNVTKSMSALIAGLQSAGVEGGTVSSVVDMITSSITDPELMKGLSKMGIAPLKALREGRPEEVIATLGRISESMKAGSFFSGKMAEKYSEKFGVASDVIFQLSGKTQEATKNISDFYSMSLNAGKSVAQLSGERENQRTLWGNMVTGIKNFAATSGLISGLTDTLEGMGPALQAGYAGFMLLKQAGLALGLIKPPIVAVTAAQNAQAVSTTALSVTQKIAAASTSLLAGATAALNFLFVTTPIGWVVLAVGALVAALVLAYKKSETFRNIVNGLWLSVKEFGMAIYEFVLPHLGMIKEYLFMLINPFGLLIKGFEILRNLTADTPVGGFFDWIYQGISKLRAPFDWLWEKMSGIFKIFEKKGAEGSKNKTTPMVERTTPVVTDKTAAGKPIVNVKTEAGKEMKVTLDQSDVVGALNKMITILTDIRDRETPRGKSRTTYRGEISPDKLALNGTI